MRAGLRCQNTGIPPFPSVALRVKMTTVAMYAKLRCMPIKLRDMTLEIEPAVCVFAQGTRP
jgi:hypothetical protein